MKKKCLCKTFLILFFLLSICSIAVFYINKFVLPVKIKSLIIQNLEKETRKKITLESVQFNILKGLILRNLSVWDGDRKLISLKEASFSFLILPILRERKIIIPNARILEPVIFLERKADGCFNLQELIPKQKDAAAKPKFGLIISALNLTAGHIDFKDNTLSPPFTKSITGVNLNIFFSLPASIRFEAKGKILSALQTTLNADGQFLIASREFRAKVNLQNARIKDLSPYYKGIGLDIKDGAVDAFIQLGLKGGLLALDTELKVRDIALSKDKIFLSLNADASSMLQYNLADKRLILSGKADIFKTGVSGVETIGEIKDINGRISFSDSGIASDKILANVFGLPIEAKITLSDFKSPGISLEAASELSLSDLQKIVLEKFKASLPAEITGQGKLLLNVTAKPASQEPPQVNGSLNISSAVVKIDKAASPLKDIHGLLSFDMNKLSWSNLSFKYQESEYRSEGELIDYLPAGQAGKNPTVSFSLSSPELSLTSRLSLTKDKLIKIAELKGKYLNSGFFLKGDLDIADMQSIPCRLNIDADINLDDLNKPLHKFKERLEQIKPSGLVKTKINLQGSLNHPKLWALEAEASSPSLSLYGLKSGEFILRYNQYQSIADIPLIHFSFYGGTIEANAKANLDTDNLPFWVEARVNNVKIEELKEDIPGKKQDIAGTIQAITKLNGFADDLSKLSGSGKILIENGKLWELNFFKGIGKLIFTKDFTNIVFTKGDCEFFIKDKLIFSDNLTLESNLTNLKGKGKIGFDGTIDANINVEISSEFIPDSKTIKDVTTALMGEVPRFAVIKVKGTLQKPEYAFDMAVVDVLKGLTGTILESIFGQ